MIIANVSTMSQPVPVFVQTFPASTMKLFALIILLLSKKMEAFPLDNPRLIDSTPSKQAIPHEASRRVAIAALLTPLLLLPAAQPAAADAGTDLKAKVDAFVALATSELVSECALIAFVGALIGNIPTIITIQQLKDINKRNAKIMAKWNLENHAKDDGKI
jgi:uncharacterized membrane protein